jgi:DNA-binding winged helix-turn-helix (wHTH) protein
VQRSGGAYQLTDLSRLADFMLADLTCRPSVRSLQGPLGNVFLEPRMMQVLLLLSEQPGQLVTREELLERCWNGAAVGDDSLNRSISGIRRAIRQAGARNVRVETKAAAGYFLDVVATEGHSVTTDEAVDAGWRSWRLGMPAPDLATIKRLRSVLAAQPDRADAWGMLALLLRNAVEYAEPSHVATLVDECETAAARAAVLDPEEPNARAALIGIAPFYGHWAARREALLEALRLRPGEVVPCHDLAVLEMATGRPSAAAPLIEELLDRDHLSATFHYKRTYHLWTFGRLAEMDQVADRAMHLWPKHPAIWFARLWSLAFTGRPRHALLQLHDEGTRPDLPRPAYVTLEATLAAMMEPPSTEKREEAIRANILAAERGAAQSASAIVHLSGLGAVDEAFDVADGYFLRRGPYAVAVRKSTSDPSVTDQHRRITQMLFLPVAQILRDDSRFDALVEEIGLSRYWAQFGIAPDYRSSG